MATIPSNFSHVFSALDGLRSSGRNSWVALCPSHPDTKQSLSISIGRTGNLIMKCHAPHGCSIQSVVRSLNVRLSDLFADSNRDQKKMSSAPPPRKFVCSYDYRDEDGKLLFQAVRSEPKSFSQRRPNPAFDPKQPKSKDNSEWIYGLDGTRRVLYKLPELLRATRENPERWVFVVEGEKDANALWDAAFIGTCNPMGALKWDGLAYNAALKDRNVVLVPDEDPVDAKTGFSPGCRHMEEVAASLLGTAKRVRVIRLAGVPPKGDFSDWKAIQERNGKSITEWKAELAAMVKAAPDWKQGDQILPLSVLLPSTAQPSWDGEITPGLQAIGALTKDALIQFKDFPSLAARLQIEVGGVASAAILNTGVINRGYLRTTLAAIGAMAAKGIEELDKAKV